MIEHMKSLALVFLVTASIIQTLLLWYSSPSYQDNRITAFEDIPQIGHKDFKKHEIHELAAPPEILVHSKGKHQRILPSEAHQTLVEKLHHAQLENLNEITPSSARWERLINKESGLEFRFHHELPTGVIKGFFKGKETIPEEIENINRIWVFGEGDQNRVTIWLISDRTQTVTQATALIQDYKSLLNSAKQAGSMALLPFYKGEKPGLKKEDITEETIPRITYLPKKRLKVPHLTYKLEQIKVEHMKMILFRNPNYVKKTELSDQSFIYTELESLRNLRYDEKKKNMIYKNTGTESETSLPHVKELNTINAFMDRHNGWTGNYLLQSVEQDKNNNLNNYRFQLYVEGMPVFGPDNLPGFDTIRLVASQRVTEYERSLFFSPSRSEIKKPDYLPSAEEVFDSLKKQNLNLSDIQQIYPGYQAATEKKQLKLKPVWVVIFDNEKQGFLEISDTGRGTQWTGAKPNPS